MSLKQYSLFNHKNLVLCICMIIEMILKTNITFNTSRWALNRFNKKPRMIFHGDFISNVNDQQMHERQTANEVGRLLLKASARFAQASKYKAYTIMNLPPTKA